MELENINYEKLPYEEIKYLIYKTIFEYKINIDENERRKFFNELIDKLCKNPKNSKYMKTIIMAVILKEINEEHKQSRKDNMEIIGVFYDDLLSKMKNLANELNLNNTLELSNLYTYLLWNGFLSKTGENVYKMEKRKLIDGLYFADIIDGVGVCLNHTDMLKDFLNTCGYNCCSLINSLNKNINRNYNLDIHRETEEIKLATKIKHFILSPLTKPIGNHAFNLIEENEKLYIYDSTNLSILSPISYKEAIIINGKGTINLNPYFSYMLCNNENEISTLNRLLTTTDFTPLYSRKDFIITGEENIDLLKNSSSLLQDFYDEIKDDLLNISDETTKMMARKRKK